MITSAVLAGCLHFADRGLSGGLARLDPDGAVAGRDRAPAEPGTGPPDSGSDPGSGSAPSASPSPAEPPAAEEPPAGSAVTGSPGPRRATDATSEAEAGGTHFRVDTPRGPVHVFRPAGYHRATAGVVVYVHGYYVNVDQAWHEHGLGEQFAASGRNALFIAPEAPTSGTESSPWTRLSTLVARACRGAHLPIPTGPWVVVGHSAAYRTLVRWLREPEVRHVVLVDALYGNEAAFRHWLDASRTHKMTIIVKGTAKWAEPFAAAIPYTVRAPGVPASLGELTPTARAAKLLYVPSQIGHFELITERKVLPVILGRTGLPTVRRAPTAR